jgi:hypothetical protein
VICCSPAPLKRRKPHDTGAPPAPIWRYSSARAARRWCASTSGVGLRREPFVSPMQRWKCECPNTTVRYPSSRPIWAGGAVARISHAAPWLNGSRHAPPFLLLHGLASSNSPLNHRATRNPIKTPSPGRSNPVGSS